VRFALAALAMPKQLLPFTQHPQVRVRTRGYMPHWEVPGATYSITFRLHDSLPKEVVARLERERIEAERAVTNGTRELTAIERMDLAAVMERQIDRELDRHHGQAFMRDPRVADVVAAALCFFDGVRYRLYDWCVMPNHVHVIAQPHDGHTLDEILHSWKSYSSNRANEVLGRRGTFWWREYFDRVIRNEDDLVRTRRYVLENPAKAGLKDWPWTSAGWKPAERPAGSRRA
jgi:REP element-mobilizing transposase RayT